MNVKEKINKLIEEFPFVMIEQKKGKTYHLKEHWRYFSPKQECPRVLIGEGVISDNQFEYLTKKIPILKRTKFSNKK